MSHATPVDTSASWSDAADEPLSPELVLVSPDIAPIARALLPDRPWEQFVSPSRSLARATAPGWVLLNAPREGVGEAAHRRTGSEPVPVAIQRPDATPAPAAPPAREPWLPGVVRIAVLAGVFAGLASLGAWESGGESFVAEQGGRPYPRALYEASLDGTILTDGTGTIIDRFRLPLGCSLRPLTIRRIAVAPDGTFDFEGTVGPAAAPVFVELFGRFEDSENVRGVIAADGGGCAGTLVKFQARAS